MVTANVPTSDVMERPSMATRCSLVLVRCRRCVAIDDLVYGKEVIAFHAMRATEANSINGEPSCIDFGIAGR